MRCCKCCQCRVTLLRASSMCSSRAHVRSGCKQAPQASQARR
jgi:hypothetical protein